MIEKLKYVNHLREEFDFGENGVFANENDLRDYKWRTVGKPQIKGFEKTIVQKKMHIMIANRSFEVRDLIFEIAEKDIIAKQYGKIVIGDYYLNCYITGIKKKNYLVSEKYIEMDLIIETDQPNWIKETTSIFRPAALADAPTGKRNLDYNFDFNFDYKSNDTTKRLQNDSFADVNFKMIIYGGCDNPEVYIGDHLYGLNLSLSDNEYVIIDSIKKTIKYHRYNSEVVNVFNNRNRDSYIFEKIKPRHNVVSWSGAFGFDITVYEERSEPKWI